MWDIYQDHAGTWQVSEFSRTGKYHFRAAAVSAANNKNRPQNFTRG